MLRSPIVLVGGTALAGWRIRSHSHDVDIYIPEISADAVEIVEQEFRARHGASFRLDVTTGENVWGSILVRDIASSPTLGTIADLELRALRIEDLFGTPPGLVGGSGPMKYHVELPNKFRD